MVALYTKYSPAANTAILESRRLITILRRHVKRFVNALPVTYTSPSTNLNAYLQAHLIARLMYDFGNVLQETRTPPTVTPADVSEAISRSW